MLLWLLLLLVGIPIGIPLLLAWGSVRLVPFVQTLVKAQQEKPSQGAQ